MSLAHFSLSWEAHKKNICHGLSSLQQNGEFVDMTLAADGHLVKVHQVIIALASPYLKELIASAQCPHPVIFLNKVSYATLCSILEYIYIGEVLVAKDNITELIEAAKELHIKGLGDMKVELATDDVQPNIIQSHSGKPLAKSGYLRASQSDAKDSLYVINSNRNNQAGVEITVEHDDSHQNEIEVDETFDDEIEMDQIEEVNTTIATNTNVVTRKPDVEKRMKDPKTISTQIQYTVTNQGALQMILNRYMYYLRYTSRKGANGHRAWRCINYTKELTKCPAGVLTQDDVVIKRYGAHNHAFHDQKILKKVRDKAVFSTLTDAEINCVTKKRERCEDKTEPTVAKKSKNDANSSDAE